MTDDITTQSDELASVPAGLTFAADNIGGKVYLRDKIGWGADGSYVDASAANPLPVGVTGTVPLPTGAATAAKQDTLIAAVDGVEALLAGASTLAEQQTQTTALGGLTETAPATDTASSGINGRLQRIAQRLTSLIALLPSSIGQKAASGSLSVTLASDDAAAASLNVMDDWDESDRAKVNPIVGQAGLQGGSGTVSANTLRMVLATDVALPAGTNAIGKLAANSGVDIGDVDVTSVAGTGTNQSGQTTVTNSSTQIVASRAGRRGVLLINNQTVAVYVDPSGGTAATTHARLDPGAAVVLPVTSAITAITSAAYTASGDAKVHWFELY